MRPFFPPSPCCCPLIRTIVCSSQTLMKQQWWCYNISSRHFCSSFKVFTANVKFFLWGVSRSTFFAWVVPCQRISLYIVIGGHGMMRTISWMLKLWHFFEGFCQKERDKESNDFFPLLFSHLFWVRKDVVLPFKVCNSSQPMPPMMVS